MLKVKYAIVPSPAKELYLEDDATVADALEALKNDGKDVTGFAMQIDGETVNAETELNEGDTIVFAKKIKGN